MKIKNFFISCICFLLLGHCQPNVYVTVVTYPEESATISAEGKKTEIYNTVTTESGRVDNKVPNVAFENITTPTEKPFEPDSKTLKDLPEE